jgi:hypothetical protein
MKEEVRQNLESWKDALLLIEKHESYGKFGEVRFRWINPRFEGEEITYVTSSPTRIEKLINKLWEINKNLVLKYVREVKIQWAYGWDESYVAKESWIAGDATVFRRLVKDAHFEWTDRAMGIYWSTLEYDEAFLEELKYLDCEIKPFGKILHVKFPSEAQKLSLKEMVENIYYHMKTHNWEMVEFLKWQLYKKLENGVQIKEVDSLLDGILLIILHEKDKQRG